MSAQASPSSRHAPSPSCSPPSPSASQIQLKADGVEPLGGWAGHQDGPAMDDRRISDGRETGGGYLTRPPLTAWLIPYRRWSRFRSDCDAATNPLYFAPLYIGGDTLLRPSPLLRS